MKESRFCIFALLLILCLWVIGAGAEMAGDVEIFTIDYPNGTTRTDYRRIRGTACGDYEYYVNEDGSATITLYLGTDPDVVIPSELDGHPVTAIGFDTEIPIYEYAERQSYYSVFGQKSIANRNLTSVVIPDGVTSIGDCAFVMCGSLTSVTIPDSVTSIGDFAFCACPNLTIHLPDSIAHIGANPFAGDGEISLSPDHPYLEIVDRVLFTRKDRTLVAYPWDNPAVVYAIPEGTLRIGPLAFYNNRNLINVGIPNGLSEIGELAFASCRALASITIPASVAEIGDYAFDYCDSLAGVTIQGSDINAFVRFFAGSDGSETRIGKWAFRRCKSLTSLTLGEGVTEIDEYAFWECTRLIGVTLPESLTRIGKGAFAKCALLSLTIPEGVEDIGPSAFAGCVYLQNLTIRNGVSDIGGYAFSGC